VNVQIVRCGAVLPDGFDRLAIAARTEGFDFVDRLGARWKDGAYDDGDNMPDPDASVFAAFEGGALRAIGAQTHDSHDPERSCRRLRHFYVHPDARRASVGRTLASALIQEAFNRAPRLHLRATHALSTAFWDAMGFTRVDHPRRTHKLMRDAA
jgi:GNAT superfamily N-acetyltransferase